MERLQSAAARAYADLLQHQPTTPAKVAFVWHLVAGPALGRAGTAEWSSEGTLRIHARDEAWRREIRRARPLILDRMTHLLGPEVVRKIVVD